MGENGGGRSTFQIVRAPQLAANHTSLATGLLSPTPLCEALQSSSLIGVFFSPVPLTNNAANLDSNPAMLRRKEELALRDPALNTSDVPSHLLELANTGGQMWSHTSLLVPPQKHPFSDPLFGAKWRSDLCISSNNSC